MLATAARDGTSSKTSGSGLYTYEEGSCFSSSLSSEWILSSLSIFAGSGRDVPCIVVVDKVAEIISSSDICSCLMTSGSIIVTLAWSSIMARPSMEWLEVGWDSCTGHVRLYKTVSDFGASDGFCRLRTSSWRPGADCQRLGSVDGGLRHPKARWCE